MIIGDDMNKPYAILIIGILISFSMYAESEVEYDRLAKNYSIKHYCAQLALGSGAAVASVVAHEFGHAGFAHTLYPGSVKDISFGVNGTDDSLARVRVNADVINAAYKRDLYKAHTMYNNGSVAGQIHANYLLVKHPLKITTIALMGPGGGLLSCLVSYKAFKKWSHDSSSTSTGGSGNNDQVFTGLIALAAALNCNNLVPSDRTDGYAILKAWSVPHDTIIKIGKTINRVKWGSLAVFCASYLHNLHNEYASYKARKKSPLCA